MPRGQAYPAQGPSARGAMIRAPPRPAGRLSVHSCGSAQEVAKELLPSV